MFLFVIVPVTFVTSCVLPFTVKLEPTTNNKNNGHNDQDDHLVHDDHGDVVVVHDDHVGLYPPA